MCCSPCSNDLFLGLLAILFPPIAVWVKRGICSADSVINILLCLLGFIPGLLHAWYIIAKYPDPTYEYESLSHDNDDRVTYVIVRNGQRAQNPTHSHTHPHAAPQTHAPMHYGTTMHAAPAGSQSQAQGYSAAGPSNGGEGASDMSVPPSYAEVVAGDHKIQH
ncbi:hypothetical protein Cpir12675_001151 [Ceratocystis pirilliformis]|uniref:Plasma membrane proteolipid 3 n=1 Tax=Ceratocystis pirilliformis TaxID=259994 RepID=A0ABR3ZJ19_9PEZI